MVKVSHERYCWDRRYTGIHRMNELQIDEVSGEANLNKIRQFRAHVWTERGMVPKGFFKGSWGDERDSFARHWVARWQGELVGTIRLAVFAGVSDLPDYFRQSGLEVAGAVGLPERLVVSPEHARKGTAVALGRAVLLASHAANVAYLLSECTEKTLAIWLAQPGRRALGPAPIDPRFPHISFHWLLSDVEAAMAAGPVLR
jgi:hypothetical protein